MKLQKHILSVFSFIVTDVRFYIAAKTLNVKVSSIFSSITLNKKSTLIIGKDFKTIFTYLGVVRVRTAMTRMYTIYNNTRLVRVTITNMYKERDDVLT